MVRKMFVVVTMRVPTISQAVVRVWSFVGVQELQLQLENERIRIFSRDLTFRSGLGLLDEALNTKALVSDPNN